MQVDEPEVWSELGHSQLESGLVADAIESYLKSGDHSRHLEVIQRSNQAGAHGALVKFLLMVRKKVKDPKVNRLSVHKPAVSDFQAITNGPSRRGF